MAKESIHVIISISAMLSVITATEAALGDTCTSMGDCVYNGATCDRGQCGCDTTGGYRVEGNQCLPNVPAVNLTGPSSIVFGQDAVFTASVVSDPEATDIIWQKVSGGATTNITVDGINVVQTGDLPAGSVILTLTIKNVTFDDEVIYQVMLLNSVGHKTSNQLVLDVTRVAPCSPLSLEKPMFGQKNCSAIANGFQCDLKCDKTYTFYNNPGLAEKTLTCSTGNSWSESIPACTPEQHVLYTSLITMTYGVERQGHTIGSNCFDDAFKSAIFAATPRTEQNFKTGCSGGIFPNDNIDININEASSFSTAITSSSGLTITYTVEQKPLGYQENSYNICALNVHSRMQKFDISITKISTTVPGCPNLVRTTAVEKSRGFICSSDKKKVAINGKDYCLDCPAGTYQSSVNTCTLCPISTFKSNNGALACSACSSGYSTYLMGATSPEQCISLCSSGTYSTTGMPPCNQCRKNSYWANSTHCEDCPNGGKTVGFGAPNIGSCIGTLTVVIGSDVTGKIGESVTLSCIVAGPEISQIIWKKGGADLSIDGTKYTGSTPNSPSLTINKLVMQDSGQYQCTASNPGGTYKSPRNATLTVINRQFQDVCSASFPCDDSKELECSRSTGRCVCKGTFYHNNNVCHLRDRLKVIITSHLSSTSTFSVSWNSPSTDVNLVSEYIVRWRIHDQVESSYQSQTVNKSLTSNTVSTGLIPGQLYIVTVTSNVTLTNPDSNIEIHSGMEYIRIVPLPSGSILDSSDFASDKLMLNWTPPISNTVVTKYDVTIAGATQSTVDRNANIQFTKQLIPGTKYNVSIVTVSGQNMNNNEEKRSVAYTEEIRTTPTKPGPPTGVTCPAEPKDKSLDISWTAPTAPNGRIERYIIIVSGAVNKTVDTLSNVNTFDVMGLLKERYYTFAVKTVNDAVDPLSIESTPVTCKTTAGLPTPPTALTIGSPKSRGFPVSFSVPNDVQGQLAGYRILISDGSKCWQQIKIICNSCTEFTSVSQGCTTSTVHRVPNIAAIENVDVTGLHPNINYTVVVAAINGAGIGYSVDKTTMTEEEVPQKPSISSVVFKSDKEVELTWTLAPPSPGNVTYTVTVMEAEDNTSYVFINKKEIQCNGFRHTMIVIDSLEEFWRYKFTVKAATIKGSQTSEESGVIRTKQGVPGKVRDLTVVRKPNTYRAALVQWKVPFLRDQNGILVNYSFSSNTTGSTDKLVPVDTTEQYATEEEIVVVPEMAYFIEIYAINSEDTIGEKETFIYSAEAGPPPITSDKGIVLTIPGENLKSETTIEIDINTDFFTNKENGEPVYFGIAVCASCGNANFAGNGQKEYENLPGWYAARTRGFPLYRVTNQTYIEDIKNLTSKRSKRSTVVPFTIGEDSICESQGPTAHCNGPLSPGLSYTMIVFVCTNGGCTKSGYIGPFATQRGLQAEELDPQATSSVGTIVGSIAGVIILITALVMVIFIWKRKRSESKRESKAYADLTLHDRGSSEQTYSPLDQRTRIQREKPIHLHSFVDHVLDLIKDSRLKICNEFSELLRSKETSTTTKATSKINANRNRGSVVPYDFNRVQLQGKRGESDYVNASFVLNQSYIMTQYPLPKTAGHFWRMVWEQNCPSIVALTIDDEKYKEEWYFPASDGAVRTVGGIDVELVVTFDVLEKVTLRKIKLSKGKQLKNVNHIHAYGTEMVNMSEQLLNFINLVKSNNAKIQSNGPYVVHGGCVGINYSGVFVLVDYLVDLIESGVDMIDVYGSTLTIMSERMDALTKEEQYTAIYMCLKTYINNKARSGNHNDTIERKDAASAYEYLP